MFWLVRTPVLGMQSLSQLRGSLHGHGMQVHSLKIHRDSTAGFKCLLNEKGRTDASDGGFFTLVENLGKGGAGRLTCETSELRRVFKSQSHACNQPLSLLSLKLSTAQHRSWERFSFPRYHLICYPHTKKAAASQAFTLVASIPTKEKLFFFFYTNLVLISSVPISVSLQGTKLSQEAW